MPGVTIEAAIRSDARTRGAFRAAAAQKRVITEPLGFLNPNKFCKLNPRPTDNASRGCSDDCQLR